MASGRGIGIDTAHTLDARTETVRIHSDVSGSARVTPAQLSNKVARQVFVAYPYRLYPRADYRRVFAELGTAFDVNFVFADEAISNLHVLDKIKNYIRESQFGIYDISGWNSNVTLELGLAFGLEERAFIAFDPSKTEINEVPSDLRGFDRIQYDSYAALGEGLTRLLGQELPAQQTHDAENQVIQLRERVLGLVSETDGLAIADIAQLLGVSVPLAQVVVRPMTGHGLRTTGQRRGMKYFLDPATR